MADKICNATKSFLSSFFFSIPWTGEPGACCLLVFSSDHTAPPLHWLVAAGGNINVLGNKTHLSTAAAFPLQTRVTHSQGRPLNGNTVLRCSMDYCGFITSFGGFNPCNNHHNSESLWWISSTQSDFSDSLEKCIQYLRQNLFSN